MNPLKTINLKATSGKETITNARDVFSWIDSDFKNWNTDVKGKKTKAEKFTVCELTENKTFTQIFTKPEEMCMTQGQIIEFVKTYKSKLNRTWANFFLSKVGAEFFVAYVSRYGDGWSVRAFRLSCDCVWYGEYRYRFVIPQRTLNSSDSEPLTLKNLDTLKCPHCNKEIEVVLQAKQ